MRTILSLFPGLMSGRRLADEGELKLMLQLLFSTQANIAGSGTEPGPLLDAAINQVVGVGQHAILPPALAGRQITVVNGTNGDLLVHAQATNSANNNQPDVFGGGAAIADVPMDTTAIFVSHATGFWTEVVTVAPLPPP